MSSHAPKGTPQLSCCKTYGDLLRLQPLSPALARSGRRGRRCSGPAGAEAPTGCHDAYWTDAAVVDCARKKRIISRLASGPRGSVYEPAALPPDQAWPAS
jgi:hypothetical protein